MAAISTYAAWEACRKETIGLTFHKSVVTNSIACSTWLSTPNAGTTPSTAAVCNASTAGALNQGFTLTSNTLQTWLASCAVLGVGATPPIGTCLLIDRLSHQGGLSGNDGSAQTTNLPTAALTRYTSGVGVRCSLQIYTAIGATPTTVTVSYTNQAGTAGRTSVATVFGGSGNNAAARCIEIMPQAGDTGFRSVASVTLAGSTGTAGNFGVTLYKPLCMFMFTGHDAVFLGKNEAFLGGMFSDEIISDACLDYRACSDELLQTCGTMEFIQS